METQDEKPPFFQTWTQMYAFVLAFLVAMIGMLYWFSRAFV